MKIIKIKMDTTYWALLKENDRTRYYIKLSKAILKYRSLKRF